MGKTIVGMQFMGSTDVLNLEWFNTVMAQWLMLANALEQRLHKGLWNHERIAWDLQVWFADKPTEAYIQASVERCISESMVKAIEQIVGSAGMGYIRVTNSSRCYLAIRSEGYIYEEGNSLAHRLPLSSVKPLRGLVSMLSKKLKRDVKR